MSEKPVEWQTDIHNDFNACIHKEHCRELKRQRDAAVDALKNLMESESRGRVMPIGNAWDAARAALREIEGKS